MLTGKQIREARRILSLQRSKLAERAGVPHAIIKIAEMTDGECPITIGRANQIRRAIEAAGVELFGEGDEAGARRRGVQRDPGAAEPARDAGVSPPTGREGDEP